MVLDQRPRIVEQHLLRHPAKAPERAFHAIEPGRLPLVPKGPYKRPPRIAQCRHKQMHSHRVTADCYCGCPEIDLQLPARCRLKPQAGPRLGPPRLTQRRHRALHRSQRYCDAVFAQEILAHHIAVAAMPPKALCQPLFEPVEPPLAARLTNRHPAARRKIPLHGIAAASQLAGDPLGPPAQSVQLHHRRHLLRRQHHLSPRIQSPG